MIVYPISIILLFINLKLYTLLYSFNHFIIFATVLNLVVVLFINKYFHLSKKNMQTAD